MTRKREPHQPHSQYVTASYDPNDLARELAWQWRHEGHQDTVIRALHRVQPRRKCIWVSLMVHALLVKFDPLVAAGFVEAMKPKKGKSYEE